MKTALAYRGREALRVSLVEDDPGGRRAAAAILSRAGFEVTAFERAEDYLAARPAGEVLLTDLMLPGLDGLELLARLQAEGDGPEVILITAYGTAEVAAKAMGDGAFHFLTKPLDPELMVQTVRRAGERVHMRSEVARLRHQMAKHSGSEILGASAAADQMREQLARLAQSDLPILIQGPSGCGKELAARALHFGGPRSEESFVAINCAAIPEALLESELFGHTRGAFTGADRKRMGRFQEADRGTLFLDEIGEMPTSLQAKLLRVLENGELTPLGSDRSVKVDVRVVSATNTDVKESLRNDLYYRLAGATLTVPSLAERSDDIPLLIAHFLEQQGGTSAPKLGAKALETLQQHPWPGNVRELRHYTARLCALHPGEELEDVPEAMSSHPQQSSRGMNIDPDWDMKRIESEVIRWTLARFQGNRELAAKALGLGVRTIYRRLKEEEPSDS